MLVCQQMSYNSFKKWNYQKLFIYKSYMYIHLNVGKQMTDVQLLLLHSNTRNHLIAWKNKTEIRLV